MKKILVLGLTDTFGGLEKIILELFSLLNLPRDVILNLFIFFIEIFNSD